VNKVYEIHGDSETVWNMGLWERERGRERKRKHFSMGPKLIMFSRYLKNMFSRNTEEWEICRILGSLTLIMASLT